MKNLNTQQKIIIPHQLDGRNTEHLKIITWETPILIEKDETDNVLYMIRTNQPTNHKACTQKK